MEGGIDSTLWHAEDHPEWSINPDIGMLSFYIPSSILSPEAYEVTKILDYIVDIVQLNGIYELYYMGTKPLLYVGVKKPFTIHGVPFEVGGALYFDLADLLKVTPEGKQGWTTVWAAANLGGVAYSIDIADDYIANNGVINPSKLKTSLGVGILMHEFEYNQRGIADYRQYPLEFGKIVTPFFSITSAQIEQDLTLNGPKLSFSGPNEYGFYVEDAQLDLYKFEINTDKVLAALNIKNALKGIYSSDEYSEMIVDEIDSIKDEEGIFRDFTYDDGDWPIEEGTPQNELSMRIVDNSWENSAHRFVIKVPETATNLKFSTIGGTGDVALVSKYSSRVDLSNPYELYEHSYTEGSTEETITISDPDAGLYYIALFVGDYDGNYEYNNVKFIATYDTISEQKIIRIDGDLSFGEVHVGQNSQMVFTIYNDGNSTLNVSEITYPTGFSGNWSEGSISAGDYKEVIVTFTPQTAQVYSGNISVTSNKTSGTNTIECSGAGIVEQLDIEKWRFTTQGKIYSKSLAIDSEGTIYIASEDAYLYAIYPNGNMKWEYLTGGLIRSSPTIGTDGTIYIGSSDGYLHVINSDGSLKWKYFTGSGISSCPAIGADETIYVGADDGYLYAINPDGSLNWKFEIGGGMIRSSPAIGIDGTIYVGSNETYFYAINSDGTLKWKFAMGQAVFSSPAIGADGTIYVGSYTGVIEGLTPEGDRTLYIRTEGKTYSSPAIGVDGTIYIGSMDNYLYAVNPDNSIKWKYLTGALIRSSPTIGIDGTIYVGSTDGYLHAVNSDGSLKWKFYTGEILDSSPNIGEDGTIYICSYEGILYALDNNAGKLAESVWPRFHNDLQNRGKIIDYCQDDPNKIEPGICGCGIPDIDTDVDGTLDCNDECPNDPGKTSSGICGCGIEDTDTDNDGVPDCNDGCPNDHDKIASGACGCGTEDIDSDGDETPDCNDYCPDDFHKTTPGECGCGVEDIDTDEDGVYNCNDTFPEDPDEYEDSDGDGIGNNSDLFPGDPTEQYDLDEDGIGNNKDPDKDGDSILNEYDINPDSPYEANVNSAKGDVELSVEVIGDAAKISKLEGINEDNSTQIPSGFNSPYGVFSLDLKDIPVGGTVRVRLGFSQDLPGNFELHKHYNGKWEKFSYTKVDGRTIEIKLTDGVTPGDSDNSENGIILDPFTILTPTSTDDDTDNQPVTDSGDGGSGGGGGGGGVFGNIGLNDVVGYHFDWNNKDGTAVYMPVTKAFKALKGAQTHVEGFAPHLANFIRKRFDALERRAKKNPDGLLSKTGTYLFPILGKIAEFYLDIVGKKELMTNAYSKTTISIKEYNELHREGKAVSSHIVKGDE